MMANVDLRVRWNNYLPHWTKDDATYHIRFRLADSLPQEQLQAWREEKAEIFATAKQEDRPLNDYEKDRLEFLRTKKIEQLLDVGYGECWLSRDEIAKIVRDALHYFDDERYRLLAWCIMPNHVHIIVQPTGEHQLYEIVRSWKTFTAREANKILSKTGSFWQREYFDHLIRNQERLENTVEYVWNNPTAAGLMNWKWRWRCDV